MENADALICINGDALEDVILRAPIDIIQIRDRIDLCSRISFLTGIVLTDCDEILRLAKRKRPQQYGVEDAEHCGIGPDTESESQNDNRGEKRLLAKNSQGVSKILHKLFGTKCDDWIDARRAAGRNPRGKEGRGEEKRADAKINSWIDSLNVKKDVLHCA